jgi:serine/threonine protein kinase
MAKKLTVNGIALEQLEDLGAGGQGQAYKVSSVNTPQLPMVLKCMDIDIEGVERAKGLVDVSLPALSPYLAGPVFMDAHKGKIRHLSPFASGADLENDRPRTFAENMEVAHHLECQACILEEQLLAHGDYAPANVKISDDGAVTIIDFDNIKFASSSLPAPQMAGQAMMMAPELRSGTTGVTIQSDRFARAILQNMILLGRYPADGLANNPAERNAAMSQGIWPEHQRTRLPDETPTEALGNDLIGLFDLAFSLDPLQRPSAEQWRRTLLRGLHNLYIHDCGQAFVIDNGQSHCPWCQQAISVPSQNLVLRIKVKSANVRYKVSLEDGKPLIIGRGNLGGMSGLVSTRHLQITRTGSDIHLKHVGRNPSKIWKGGSWNGFDTITLNEATMRQFIYLQLADCELEIRVTQN